MADRTVLYVNADGTLEQMSPTDALLADVFNRLSSSGNLGVGSNVTGAGEDIVIGANLSATGEILLGSVSSLAHILGDLDLDGQMAGTLDMGNQNLDNAKTVSYNAVGSGSGTGTVDWSSYQKYSWTISTSATLTFTAPAGPCNVVLKLINGGTGTITWPGTVLWAGGTEPSWTTSGTDIVAFFWDGTNYYGAASLDFS